MSDDEIHDTRAAIERDEALRVEAAAILRDERFDAAAPNANLIERASRISLSGVYQAGQSGRVRGPWASTVQLLAIRVADAERKLAEIQGET